MKQLILLVGPPGSGKSTLAKEFENSHKRISQDDQGKDGHLEYFLQCLRFEWPVVIDRMNFNKEQRERYLAPAKEAGYSTKIIVLHVPKDVCLSRMKARQDHPTIKDEATASKVLHFFHKSYERVEDNEADVVERRGWEGIKERALVSDLDGTLCDTSKRQHYVKRDGKKDWKNFFAEIPNDDIVHSVHETLYQFQNDYKIILVSARPDDHRKVTEEWLKKHNVNYDQLIMREQNDFRRDDIVKEQILEFELKPKYDILFVLDDRDQVVNKWREHGISCFQVAPGEF